MKQTFKSGVCRILFPLILFFSVPVLLGQNVPDLAWARIITNSGISTAGPLAIDNQNNTYVSGSFNTSITINGTTITHLNPGGGASNYLIKYDQNGNGIWIKKIPFTINKMLTYGNKLYIIATYFQATQHFDGIPFPTPSTPEGAYCLIQINLDGSTQWIRAIDYNGLSIGGFSTDVTITIDQSGKIYVAGIFQSSITFHNGFTLETAGNQLGMNAFRAAYDDAGNLLNAYQLGVVNPSYSSYEDEFFDMDAQYNVYRYVNSERKLIKYDLQGNSVMETTFNNTGTGSVSFTGMSVDPSGNIFFCGSLYGGSANLNGHSITKHGDVNKADGVTLKLRASDGEIAWVNRYTYIHCDYFYQLLTDAIGNVYVIGNYGMCIGGDLDAMFLKYAPDGTLIWGHNIVAGPPPFVGAPSGWVTSEYLTQASNGGNVIISGYFKERVQFDPSTSFSGSNLPRAFVAQYGICNTPVPALAGNTSFCQGDSLELSVDELPGYSYMWSNGDTTASIYVNTPGDYWVTVAENNECYAGSEIMEVTENELPDATVTFNGGTLTAVEGYSYQWLDCNNGDSPVTGAVGVVFTPQQNGSYAVAVTNEHGCTVTSTCYLISNVGVEQQEMKKLSVYPNPASESVRISNVPKYARIVVRDMTGRIVFENPKAKETETIGLALFRNGVYLVEIIHEGTTRTEKLIVNK